MSDKEAYCGPTPLSLKNMPSCSDYKAIAEANAAIIEVMENQERRRSAKIKRLREAAAEVVAVLDASNEHRRLLMHLALLAKEGEEGHAEAKKRLRQLDQQPRAFDMGTAAAHVKDALAEVEAMDGEEGE